jgi:hypothetical protein
LGVTRGAGAAIGDMNPSQRAESDGRRAENGDIGWTGSRLGGFAEMFRRGRRRGVVGATMDEEEGEVVTFMASVVKLDTDAGDAGIVSEA